MSVYILTGRFQPIHNGHVSFVEDFIAGHPDDKFILAIIRDCYQSELVTEFDFIGNMNFQSEKNPYSASQVLEMIELVFEKRLPRKVMTTLLPRPSDLTWRIIDSLFQFEDRIWIFPIPEDITQRKWEDDKASFFASKKERIIRVPINKSISATEIRDCIKRRDFQSLSDKVPKEIIPLILAIKPPD